jgi:hypothetical protein
MKKVINYEEQYFEKNRIKNAEKRYIIVLGIKLT